MFASEIQQMLGKRKKPHHNTKIALIGFELNNHIGFGLPQCVLSIKAEGEHYSNHLVGKEICVQADWSVRPVKS